MSPYITSPVGDYFRFFHFGRGVFYCEMKIEQNKIRKAFRHDFHEASLIFFVF